MNGSVFTGKYENGERVEGVLAHEGKSYEGKVKTDRIENDRTRLTITAGKGTYAVFEYSEVIITFISSDGEE